LFANAANDPEGKTFLGFVLLSGNGGIATGQFSTTNDPSVITATATNLVSGNPTDTSQFSGFCKINYPPVAPDETVTALENSPVAITLAATDADGDPLTYTVVSGPSNGTLSGSGASLTYTAATNYLGPDSFTFKANDGLADSNVATVNISVQTSIAYNFNGPDAPALGAPWQLPPLPEKFHFTYRRHDGVSSFVEQNNAAQSASTAITANQIAGLSLQNPTLQADVNATDPQALAVGLLARIQSNGDAYGAILTNSGTIAIGIFHASTNTFSALTSTSTLGDTSGTLQFVVSGSSLTLTFTGTGSPIILNWNDSTLSTPGGVGIFAQGPNGIIDNFSVSGT
jgi:hypothetical protein